MAPTVIKSNKYSYETSYIKYEIAKKSLNKGENMNGGIK
jgi:hypothetical protein